jgi:hypothetical protein
MEYDIYVFTNRSVYLILKLILKRGLIAHNMKKIDKYIQQNFYQLGPLLACGPGPGAVCLWLSTSFWEFSPSF